MKLRSASGGLVLALSLAGAAPAQEPQAAAQTEVKAAAPVVTAATPAPSPKAEKLILKEGADVSLKFSQELIPKAVAEDDPVNRVVDQDLRSGGTVITKAVTEAWRTLTRGK